VESFKIFQGRIHKAYETLARRHRFTRINSDRPVEAIQEEVRAILRDRIDLARYKVTVPRGWRV
jgi:thymidylate kinase